MEVTVLHQVDCNAPHSPDREGDECRASPAQKVYSQFISSIRVTDRSWLKHAMQQDWKDHQLGWSGSSSSSGAPDDVAERMLLVLKAHKEVDNQCRSQAESAGLEVENLSVADIAYPLVTKRVIGQCLMRERDCVCV